MPLHCKYEVQKIDNSSEYGTVKIIITVWDTVKHFTKDESTNYETNKNLFQINTTTKKKNNLETSSKIVKHDETDTKKDGETENNGEDTNDSNHDESDAYMCNSVLHVP